MSIPLDRYNIHQFFATIPARFRAEKARGTSGIFHFIIDEQTFSVIIEKDECHVEQRAVGNPKCVIRTSEKNYKRIELGLLNPQWALMTRKVKVSNIAAMQEFGKLFRRFSERYLGNEGNLELSGISPRKPVGGVLAGVRVLDLSRLLPGPLGAKMLAERGAEVIKIEDPESADDTRNYAPYIDGQSIYYLTLNNCKRSLALNLNSEEGKNIFKKLVLTADVLLESFRPGIMRKLGLAYEVVSQINSKIVYVSVTGYGQTGVYAQEAGHDLNYLATSGLLGLMKDERGKPIMPGVQIADIAAGSMAVLNACLEGLYKQEKTGVGSYHDVSMTDHLLPLLSMPYADHQATGRVKSNAEMDLSGRLPNYNVYECADGRYMALGALEPKFWNRFCQLVKREEWEQQILLEGEALENFKQEVADLFKTKSSSEWLALAQSADCCLTLIQDLDELQNDPHIVSRDNFVEYTHAQYGSYQVIHSQPVNKCYGWAAPLLGEDTLAIMYELGYAENEIKKLLHKGAISLV